MSSKKEQQAIELFNQGKQPGDPELVALGLKPRTVQDYFSKWRTPPSVPAQKPGPEPGQEVEISSLGTLQPFSYEGDIYTKRKVKPGGVQALSQEGDRLITLAPDTLVITV
jgi:hypothetical protein